jgi:hypothetical protein
MAVIKIQSKYRLWKANKIMAMKKEQAMWKKEAEEIKKFNSFNS